MRFRCRSRFYRLAGLEVDLANEFWSVYRADFGLRDLPFVLVAAFLSRCCSLSRCVLIGLTIFLSLCRELFGFVFLILVDLELLVQNVGFSLLQTKIGVVIGDCDVLLPKCLNDCRDRDVEVFCYFAYLYSRHVGRRVFMSL